VISLTALFDHAAVSRSDQWSASAAIVSHIEKRCATLDQRALRVCSLNTGLHFRLAARPQCSMESALLKPPRPGDLATSALAP
jgi:hypothetical protein